MKTLQYTKVIFGLCMGVMLYGCDSFTEVDLPQTQLTGEAVYQDEVTATAALSDIYARMRENGVVSGNTDGLSPLMGLYADELTFYGNALAPADNFYNHTVIPSNAYVSSLWSNSYAQIYAANALFEGVSNSAISGESRNRLLGEALFIRALLHFYLVNLYGDIPYIETTNYQVNAHVGRMSVNSVYDKISNDLQTAKSIVPDAYISADRIRPNKATVQALLARVYLYREQWALAETEATALIDNAALYTLETNLDAAFLNTNPSTILQLHAGMAGANTNEGRLFIFTSGPPISMAVNNELVNAFETNDLRKTHWLKAVTDGTTTWYHPYKYKQNANTGVSQEYSILFRLEEQYLIRAEARAHQNDIVGAQNDLNTIRNRSGLGNTIAATQQDLLMAISKERQVELFTEQGHRWFDLRRTGQASNILSPIKPAWQNTDIALPLPESELILNPNLQPQNSGY